MLLAEIITSIGTILTGVLGWFTSVIAFALGEPLIVFAVLTPVVYGLIRKGLKVVSKRKI